MAEGWGTSRGRVLLLLLLILSDIGFRRFPIFFFHIKTISNITVTLDTFNASHHRKLARLSSHISFLDVSFRKFSFTPLHDRTSVFRSETLVLCTRRGTFLAVIIPSRLRLYPRSGRAKLGLATTGTITRAATSTGSVVDSKLNA